MTQRFKRVYPCAVCGADVIATMKRGRFYASCDCGEIECRTDNPERWIILRDDE